MRLPSFFRIMRNFLGIAILVLFSLPVLVFGQETGGIKGKVRAANEKALAEATITARQDGKDIKSVKTDRNGNFLLSGLAPGIYNFLFEKDGFASGVKYNVKIEQNQVRDLGDRLILAVDPGTLVFIKGSVFTPDGKSYPGVDIKIERISADGKTKKVGSGYTNESGEFAFRFPDAVAKYRVTASIKGMKESQEVEVANAAVYRVAFTMKGSKDDK